MSKRKICIVTGTRAEYGHLYWVIKRIHEDPDLELQLLVTGMHLSYEFGLTVKEIEKDQFPISERVEMLLSSDTETAIATSMGVGMIGFAKAYERLKPDILMVSGDRFELLSAVAAIIPFRIPVAHIAGGETTEGAIDEVIRHALTKMSRVHFTSTDKYSDRVIQMGERPENVFCFGAPGLDNVYNLKLMDREDLSGNLGIPNDEKFGMVTYHPVTLEKDTADYQISELLKALAKRSDIYWVFTLPNADPGGRVIMERIEEFVSAYPGKRKVFTSLGQLRYLSLAKHAELMAGNSSSGIIEAPSFGLPVVNIGDRQAGRIRAQNVIDVEEFREERISDALDKAVSTEFKCSLRGMINPYGEGNSSGKIVDVLKNLSLDDLVKKQFQDVKNTE